jgi:chorismate synthase
MAGNRFGSIFRITTFGESHGPAVGVVLDGVRPGLPFDIGVIQKELDRRRPGQSKVTTPRKEADQAVVLSGVYEGTTTGTPLCIVVWNKDQRPAAYQKIKSLFRPGHAGYTYLAKYGIADYRGGGRSSGRETIGRVAAGAMAKEMLAKHGIAVIGYTIEAAGVHAKEMDFSVIESNSLRCPDATAAKKMERRIFKAMKEGDSVGGVVEVTVTNPPVGLGEPVFDKLEADLARALMSIGAIRGVEIGNGFASSRLRGSENNDAIYFDKRTGRVRTRTNRAGGIAGGISNGEDIVVRIAVKPTSSIRKQQETTTVNGKAATISVEGRHDPCICPRVVPVAEAMVALTLVDHLLRQQVLSPPSSARSRRAAIELIEWELGVLKNERKKLLSGLTKRGGRVYT